MFLRKDSVPRFSHKLVLVFAFGLSACLSAANLCLSMTRIEFERPKTQLGLHKVASAVFHIDDIKARSGEEVPVRISLPTADDFAKIGGKEGIFILIRNVPDTIQLSAGLTSGGIWAVTLRQAEDLRLRSNRDAVGTFYLDFDLVRLKKGILGSKRVTVYLTAPQAENDAVTLLPPQINQTARSGIPKELIEKTKPLPSASPPLSKAEEELLLNRAREIMLTGEIVGARILYEELAARGSRRGALALAQTYDPVNESGATPDIQKALKWYERAGELGSEEAKQRGAELAAQ